MTTIEFFGMFGHAVRQTIHWRTMEKTVEDSPWHREANVAVHTQMTINEYMENFYAHRTERQRMLSLMALLFHDFGKPEAEEVLEKKEEPGVFYRRYAGHEPVSANEFMSFMCDHHELREMFFAQGYNWHDIRTIKVMIEHHLPYGLKNEQKRQNLAHMLDATFGEDKIAYFDMLRSDCWGRISDNHDEKKLNVELWIENFQLVKWKERDFKEYAPSLIMVVGVSGAGKSTWINEFLTIDPTYRVFSEDELRMEYAVTHLNEKFDIEEWSYMSKAERYQAAWNFCHLDKDSKYDQFAKAKYNELLASGSNIIVDRMNQGRKARGSYIQPAKDKGYVVTSVEFYISESTAKERQKTRGDKDLPPNRVHQIFMQLETPWMGPEVDGVLIIPPEGL